MAKTGVAKRINFGINENIGENWGSEAIKMNMIESHAHPTHLPEDVETQTEKQRVDERNHANEKARSPKTERKRMNERRSTAL